MAGEGEKIVEVLKKHLHRDVMTSGAVQSVDNAAFTCDVLCANGMEIPAAQLKTLKDATKGLVLIPAVGSEVWMINIGDEWLVLSIEELDKIIGIVGNSTFTIDTDGYSLQRSGESLANIMQDLMTALAQMTYTNGGGTTGVANNVADLNTIKTRLQNVLK